MSEHTEQCAVMDWANLHVERYPVLRLLHAIPNGGKRHAKTAADLLAEGVKSGVPDLNLPVARHGHHSLWLEIKVGRNKPSPEQYAFIDALRAEGHKAEVCYGAARAIQIIWFYLRMNCNCAACQEYVGAPAVEA